MGFWAKLFGRAGSATGGTAPEDGGSKPAPESQAPEQQASAPPPAEESASPEESGETQPDPAPEAPEQQNPGAPAPASSPDPEPAELSDGVRYLLTTHDAYPVDPKFQATKKVYQSPSRESAIAFLKTQVVTEPLFYIEVQTPDGPFAIDSGQRVFDGKGHFIEA